MNLHPARYIQRVFRRLLGVSFYILRRLSALRGFSALLAFVFTHMSFLVATQRLHETPTLVAFYHPAPSYPLHILIVPKRDIASFSQLGPEDAGFLTDLAAAVRRLVQQFGLEQRGYRLIANGGKYQEMPLLHFHLVSDSPPASQLTKL